MEERETREWEPWAYGGISANVMSGSPAPLVTCPYPPFPILGLDHLFNSTAARRPLMPQH